MRGAVSGLILLRPHSLAEALKMLGERGGTAGVGTGDAPGGAGGNDDTLTPIAGCTDLYVALNAGTLAATRFVDLSALDALRRIALRGDVLRVGALATCTALQRSRLVKQRAPILAAAAAEVGGVQIQHRGTIGGNIANASPAGDTLPVLAALEAVVVLRSAGGERRVPLTSFYTGYRATVRRPDELIVAVEIPPADGKQWFRKVGTRAAQAISKVVMAAVRPARGAPRIALGSVAPTVIRLPRTEAYLGGGGSIDEAQRVLQDEIAPIDDLRSTADYRRRVAGNLLAQMWKETEY